MQIKIWWPLLFVAAIITTSILIFPSDLRLADLLGRAGKTDEAIKAYRMLLEEDPLRNDIRIHLAKLYIAKGDFEKAVAEIENMGQNFITDPVMLNQIADIYSQMGKKEKTVATLEHIVLLRPDDEAAQLKVAEAYEWAEQTEKAIVQYNRLLSNSPHDVKLLNKLVSLNLTLRKYDRAKYYLTRLVAVEPRNAEARELLGNIYLQLNQKEFAAVEYERVLKLNPDNPQLRQKIADIYLWIGNYDRGIPHYEQLVIDNVLQDVYFNKLIALTEQHYPDKAVNYYNYRLRYLPEDDKTRERLVQQYINMGLTEEAIAQTRILIENEPTNFDYKKNLAELYQDILEPGLAADIYENLLAQNYFDREMITTLNEYYNENKAYDKLLKLYNRLAATDTLAVDYAVEYASLLNRLERYPDATEHFERVLQHNPQDTHSRIQLTNLYSHAGDDKNALLSVKDGVEKYCPGDIEFLNYAARFFDQHECFTESARTYERLIDLETDKSAYQNLLLTAYVNGGEYAKASRLCKDLMQTEPENTELKFDYANILWAQNSPTEMHAFLENVKKEHADKTFINRDIGEFYFHKGFYAAAIDNLKQQLNLSPGDSVSMQLLVLALAWSNAPEAARSAFNEYHKSYPNDYYSRYHYGLLLANTGRKKQAAKELAHAETIISQTPPTRQSRTVQANIFAYQGKADAAIAEYELLLAEYKQDVSLQLDFAEALLILKNYEKCQQYLESFLAKQQNDYRALRLKSRSYYEQKKYSMAVLSLKKLTQLYPLDSGVALDLADTQLAAGDWFSSQHTLRAILENQPGHTPAQQRLMQIRRIHSEEFAIDYSSTTQSDNYLQRAAHFVFQKAKSSLLGFKFFAGEEKYSTQGNLSADKSFVDIGLGILSSFGAGLETYFSGKTQKHDEDWFLAGNGYLLWQLNLNNALKLAVDYNDTWDDPLIATFQNGRVNRAQADLNVTLLKNLVSWSRVSYEQHEINGASFGNALRTNAQIAYQWRLKPDILTYYQFYNLQYSYDDAANRNIIAIPENESVHYFGAAFYHYLTNRLYFEVGGSFGRNISKDAAVYYGIVKIDYLLFRNLSVRSHFEMGSQSTLLGDDKTKSIMVDLHYFY